MVYHLFERIFDPNILNRQNNQRENRLIANGFSKEEADQLVWLQAHQNRGKQLGFFVGLASVYCFNSYFDHFERYFPRLRYQQFAKVLAKTATVYIFYKFGDYIFTSKRYGANEGRLNGTQFSNRYYTESKEQFLQNFEPLNRKFTQQEVQSFLDNQVRGEYEERNWIYNPHLHGDDEQAWRQQLAIDASAPWERQDVQNSIQLENQEKVKKQEQVQVKPFKLTQHIDKTGLRHRLHPSIWFSNWTLLG